MLSFALEDPEATAALGGRVAEILGRDDSGCLVTLAGPLGAGKTTFVRGFLRALGYAGRVPSPTYTLVEPYTVNGRHVVHLDLYRLSHPEELEYLGYRDLLDGHSLVLVEWPERAAGALGDADVAIKLAIAGAGRTARVRFLSERAAALAEALQAGAP